MKPDSKRVVAVLGMHRSGTSATTRALSALGVSLGDHLAPPIAGMNDKGFWEDLDVFALDVRLLKAVDSDWDRIAPLAAADIERLRDRGLVLEAIELLRRKCADCALFGFKDPRVAKLMPFWKEAFVQGGFDVSYVIAMRNPISVARSLQKRDGFLPGKCYLLWLEYVLTCLAHVDPARCVVVDYDRLLEAPDRELARIAAALDLVVDEARLAEFASEFLDPALRHATYRAEDLALEVDCPDLAREVHAALLDVASDRARIQDPAFQRDLARWRREFQRFGACWTVLDHYAAQEAELRRTFAASEQRAAEQLADRDTRIDSLQRNATELERHLAVLKAQIQDRDGQIAAMHRSAADRDARIAELAQVAERSQRRAEQLQWAADDRGRRLSDLEHIVAEIRASHSWKITAPLRRAVDAARAVRRSIYPAPGATSSRTLPLAPGAAAAPAATAGAAHAAGTGMRPGPDPVFAEIAEPAVSIIIPVYNNWRFTQACLRAVAANSGSEIPYEVIVADDASSDETPERLQAIRGVRVVRNATNRGFLRNCNGAAQAARGRYIVLLNNDTEVQPGWLEAMAGVFERFERVGVVAGKLLYPDGRVQEAGGVMLRNGWGHPYGRFEHPDRYDLNYVREVDCAIGACLMIERALFESIGGFDERYAPAHYEEFDFEFAVRAAGRRIMYQPAAVIVHHESVSAGAEFRDRQSAINHDKFCQKWASELAGQPASAEELHAGRERPPEARRILVIEDMVPQHDKHAGALTMYQYLRLMLDLGFKVVFLPADLLPVQPYTSKLQQLGIEVIHGEFDFADWIRKNGRHYELVWMCRPDISIPYIDLVRQYSRARIAYYTHDLHFLRELRRFELEGKEWHRQEAQRLKWVEQRIFASVDVVLTPSVEEESVIRELTPAANVMTIPAYMYDLPALAQGRGRAFSDRHGMLFLGGYAHAPNVDAVLWFAREILPLVRKRIPDASFFVAGSNPPPEILSLREDGVEILGFVADLDPLFERARVFVAPLRYGAGVKGKIVTSLVQGLPVVTTVVGNEGLNLVEGESACLAQDAETFAAQVVALYSDETKWRRVAEGGRAYIRAHFSLQQARDALERVCSRPGPRCPDDEAGAARGAPVPAASA